MKRLLLLVMFLPVAMFAQEDYMPMLKDGRVWNCTFTNVSCGYSKSLTVQGDTVIDGMTWKKVYSGDQYEKAMREDGRKVYELAKGKTADAQQLLFDFGLQIGERQSFSLYEGDERYLELTAIAPVYSEGREYRMLTLKQVIVGNDETAYPDAFCYWVEGIGSDCGIEKTCQWTDVTGYTCQLKSCYENEECIFSNHIGLGLSMPSSDKRTDTYVYDLQGRRMKAVPSKGIYVKDGRKRVVF